MSKAMKWLVGGLAVSLTLNFIVIGMIIAWAAMEPESQRQARGGGSDFSLHQISKIVSPEAQKIIKGVMKDQRATLHPLFRERHQARQETAAALKADPFDPAALEAAFARMRQADMALQATAQRIVAEVAVQLPLEDRLQIATWREKTKRHSPKLLHGGPQGLRDFDQKPAPSPSR